MNQTQVDFAPVGQKKYYWLKMVIGLVAGGLAAAVLAPTCSRAITNIKNPTAFTYIAQVGLGIRVFESDHGNSAPEMANLDTFHQMIRPYITDSPLFYDPENFKPLMPNAALSHVDLSKLPHPESTVLLYDQTPKDAQRVVGYADGHVRIVSDAQFRKDLALTPLVPHSLGLYVGKWQTPLGEVAIDGKGLASLKTVGGKLLSGKAAIDTNDNLSLVFGAKAPAIVGKVTWLSINEVSVKTTGTESVLLSRIQ